MSIWEHIWATDKFYAEITGGPLFCMKMLVKDWDGRTEARLTVLWLVGKKGWSDAGQYVADNTSCWKKELIL